MALKELAMLKRKIDAVLENWLHNEKNPLLITGARQIGKTFSISHFAEKNFKYVVSINFGERNDLIDSFARLKNSDDLLVKLSMVNGGDMHEGKTLIFLDEIQLVYQRREEIAKTESVLLYQDIISAMKKMCMDQKYRFILSGSLLGVTLNNVILGPLGYLDVIEMYPLDFEEYLWAKGVGGESISYLKQCFEEKKEVDPSINRYFLDAFREYVLIGGMPAAVNMFCESKNVKRVNDIQKQISSYYVADILKYVKDERRKLRIKEIYNAIPSEVNSKNKRFMSSHVLERDYLRSHDVKDDFVWLANAAVALPVYNVKEPISPLISAEDRKTMKLFLNDAGLLTSALMQTGTREKLLSGETEINFGAPYENVVAQELAAHGFREKLFYYNSKKHGEVDFLIEVKGNALPIEIKSGKSNEMRCYNHTALNNLLKLYDYDEAFLFGEGNVIKENEKVTEFPIYMIDFVCSDE